MTDVVDKIVYNECLLCVHFQHNYLYSKNGIQRVFRCHYLDGQDDSNIGNCDYFTRINTVRIEPKTPQRKVFVALEDGSVHI